MPPFQCPVERQAGLAEVKRRVGIQHSYLDGWVYLFFENKKFNIEETVAKLERRDAMERDVFSKYVITPSLRESMRAGIVQYVGRDKEGRPVLFFNTARDSPKAEQRPERQANMDMFLSWAVRCDALNPTCTATWLINQKDASLLRNTDLIFQKDMALRISKFFPGVVARMYICNMSSALTFVMKPLLKQLPRAISECIFMVSSSDIRRGKLLELIDADVLPVAMGGNNDCDNEQNYEFFATSVEDYFERSVTSLERDGLSIKEMEVVDAFRVGKDGKPTHSVSVTPKRPTNDGNPLDPEETYTPKTAARSMSSHTAWQERVQQAAEEDLVMATSGSTASKIVVNRETSEVFARSCAGLVSAHSRHADYLSLYRSEGSLRTELSFLTAIEDVAESHDPDFDLIARMPIPRVQDVDGSFFDELLSLEGVTTAFGKGKGKKASAGAGSGMQKAPSEVYDELLRDWTQFRCLCLDLTPQLRVVTLSISQRGFFTKDYTPLKEKELMIQRVAHHMLSLFPASNVRASSPVLVWMTAKLYHSFCMTDAEEVPQKATQVPVLIECTSPDNVLLSVQGAIIHYMDACNHSLELSRAAEQVLACAMGEWRSDTTRQELLASLDGKLTVLWLQLTPYFQAYVEAKVMLSIAAFVRHYRILTKGGFVDTGAQWYVELFTGIIQYRELHRRNWLFHVFPPLFRDGGDGMQDGPPSAEELLRACRGDGQCLDPTFEAMILFVVMTENTVQMTSERMETDGGVSELSSWLLVESFLEDTGTKLYIPYESQRSGCTVEELHVEGLQSALACIQKTQKTLHEFLTLTAARFAVTHCCSGEVSDAAARAALRLMAARHAQATSSLQWARQQALGYGKCVYDMQGSFLDPTVASVPRDTPVDGYFLGLELLLLVAAVHASEGSGSGDESSSASRVSSRRRSNTSRAAVSTAARNVVELCARIDTVGEQIEAIRRSVLLPM